MNCFRASRGNSLGVDDDRPEAPRRPTFHAKKSSSWMKRQGSDGSQLSTTSITSNDSIAKLPPCKRPSDPKVEAMMMPYPFEPRPSKCLRLSHPKTYSALVSEMKYAKGCRDWRNFDVFYADEVDMSITADEAARQRAIEYQRKLRQLECSFDSDTTGRPLSPGMIG